MGGGFDLARGVVARTLAPAYLIEVAAPEYLEGRSRVAAPSDLAEMDGIVVQSLTRACRAKADAQRRTGRAGNLSE
ncbi:hypothetical protein [Phyllobacterium endophyticum]|uniref:hypothetical protein n=1 Tax=Phyllobacterium endophyticum TaxID=1149773 RepID=UPI0011CC7D58|nr:hypothetical protein [Phyllobacterium endophyticum]TXR49584.1 hypothetical protein FVA77_07915 [Phyllobacterium endophyticum]